MRLVDGSPQLDAEQLQLLQRLRWLAQQVDLNKKNEAITLASLLLGKCKNLEEQFYVYSSPFFHSQNAYYIPVL